MTRTQRIISILLLPAVLMLIIYLPQFVMPMLSRDRYREWMEPEKESFEGVITVWHIVGFKPYLGSLGSWLADRARTVEKRHFGVYFEVESMTAEDAEARLADGEFPDVLSFPSGWCSGSGLAVLNGEYDVDVSSGMDMAVLRAIPYAASCSVLLYYPSMLTADELEEGRQAAEEAAYDDFKKGKVPACRADARQAGDLQRALTAGKAEYFEILPVYGTTELVQYMGRSADCGEEKVKYIEELFDAVLSVKAQSMLCGLGLMPLNGEAEQSYDRSFLAEAYGLLESAGEGFENTFDKWHEKNGR